MKIECPACRTPMQLVQSHTHYKVPVQIEQCGNCGGVWFDTSELFTIHFKAHDELPVIDAQKLSSDTLTQNKELLCPRDKVLLKSFVDSTLPEELVLESCPVCYGFFVNRTHFADYQELRSTEPEKKEFSDKQLEAKLAVLLESQTDKEFYASLEKVGKIVTKPVPFRAFLAYWFFGLSGYAAVGLGIVMRELWLGLAGSSFKFNTQTAKENKLNEILKFIKNPK